MRAKALKITCNVNVSKERAPTIVRVEARRTLKKEAASSSETLVPVNHSTPTSQETVILNKGLTT
jgi:hypothetical protein